MKPQLQSAVRALEQVDLFKDLAPKELESVASLLRHEVFDEGSTIINEGEHGGRFYLIHSGRVNVLVDGNVVGELGPNDYFGEIAVIDNAVRTATVRSATEVSASSLASFNFSAMLRQNPDITHKLLVRLCARLRKAEEAQRSASAAS